MLPELPWQCNRGLRVNLESLLLRDMEGVLPIKQLRITVIISVGQIVRVHEFQH